jgi:hypothetical protein
MRKRMSGMPRIGSRHLGAMSEVRGRRGAVAAAALVALVALSLFLIGCEAQPRTIVVEDFESGAIADWQAVGSGAGGSGPRHSAELAG